MAKTKVTRKEFLKYVKEIIKLLEKGEKKLPSFEGQIADEEKHHKD